MNIVGKKEDSLMVRFTSPEEYFFGTNFMVCWSLGEGGSVLSLMVWSGGAVVATLMVWVGVRLRMFCTFACNRYET